MTETRTPAEDQKVSESSAETAPPVKKYRKGDLVKVNRHKYQCSIESKASDNDLPNYIFEGPGELLLIKGEYCQVRWRRPVPDVWFRLDQLDSWK